MTLNYCDIDSSWGVEVIGCAGLHSVFKYQLTQSEGVSSGEHQLEDNGRSVNNQYCQLFFENVHSESEHRDPCEIQLICKLPYNVSMFGIHVTSESRTQEIYDRDKVYMMTTSSSDVQRTQDDLPLHTTSASWDKPISGCVIKFLSLKGRESFRLYEVMVDLTQGHDSVNEASPLHTASIDMAKVKSLVGSMGGQLSDRAQAFMTTMEQYQQNKEETLSDVGKLLAQSSKPSSEMKKSTGDMSHFISMFASMNKLQARTTSPENGLISSILGSSLHGSNGDQPPPMLNFLKDICGKVSKMRESETTKTEIIEDKQENNMSEVSKLAQPTDSNSQLEKRLLTHIEGMEKRLEEKINARMQLMEESVNKKLERILDMLSQTVQVPPVSYDSCSEESSGTSSGEIALD